MAKLVKIEIVIEVEDLPSGCDEYDYGQAVLDRIIGEGLSIEEIDCHIAVM